MATRELDEAELEDRNGGDAAAIDGANDEPDVGDAIGFIDAPDDVTWYVYRQLEPGEKLSPREDGRPHYIRKYVGALDFDQVRVDCGGGTFEIRGFRPRDIGNGRRGIRKFITRRVTIEGPRKQYLPDPPAAPSVAAASAPASAGHSGALAALLERMDQRLERLERAQVPTVTTTDPFANLSSLLSVVDKLRPPVPSGGLDSDTLQTMVGLFSKGIEVGTAREPASEEGGAAWVSAARELAPVLSRAIDVLASRRQPPAGQARENPQPATVTPPPPPSGAPAPSSAVEIQTPSPDEIRLLALVDALARAITAGDRDPADFSDTVNDILSPAQVTTFRSLPFTAVLAEIRKASPTYPVLDTDQASEFIQVVHDELVNPTPEDVEP